MSDLPKDFESLLDEWAAGSLDGQQADELRTTLRENAEARERYVGWQTANSRLDDGIRFAANRR